MPNPWLKIPLADYEGHMGSPEVQQLGPLSDLFAQALRYYRPSSLAILGVAGGNGLDRIDAGITRRVVGLDVNPQYLAEIRQRYGEKYDLSLHCVDLSEERVQLDPVQLVHAALIFEHAGTGRCLENAVALVAADGVLCAVLQLASPNAEKIGGSGFASLRTLEDHFTLIEPSKFQEKMERLRFQMVGGAVHAVPGKSLWMGFFARAGSSACHPTTLWGRTAH